MNLDDRFHLYFAVDLTPFPLKLRNRKSPIQGGNERNPDVNELQRHLAVATANIVTPCDKNLTVIDSVLTSPPNNRSPPIRQEHFISRVAEMQFLSRKLHIKKYDSGGTK